MSVISLNLTDKEFRLQQFMKWNRWEEVFYNVSTETRELLFNELRENIIKYEDEV